MSLPLFHVDAFTDRPFAGNPAAVCILDGPREDSWLQGVASEMNLSETAFLLKKSDHWNLRWFTPAVEVDLCGHATLASAHILWSEGLLQNNQQALFQTRSGPLGAALTNDSIELDFPQEVEKSVQPPPSDLLKGLGVEALYVGQNRFDYLVEVGSEYILRTLKPDMNSLIKVGGRGVIVTARATTPGYDFVSRCFFPAAGIPEDPVTGSAHCCLGPYWAAKLEKRSFTAFQASPRGGVVQIRLEGNRVILGGKAVTISRGNLSLYPRSLIAAPDWRGATECRPPA